MDLGRISEQVLGRRVDQVSDYLSSLGVPVCWLETQPPGGEGQVGELRVLALRPEGDGLVCIVAREIQGERSEQSGKKD